MSRSSPIRLEPEHAEALEALEASYPPSMRLGLDALREKLERLAASEHALCWMIEQKGQCEAYVLAWVHPSQLDVPHPDDVVLIDDLQVRPGSNLMYWILRGLADDIEAQGLHGLPLEAACRRNAWRVVCEHQKAIERLGYELQGSYEYWDETLGEEMVWARWHPVRAASTSTTDSIAPSRLSQIAEEARDDADQWTPAPGEETTGEDGADGHDTWVPGQAQAVPGETGVDGDDTWAPSQAAQAELEQDGTTVQQDGTTTQQDGTTTQQDLD